MTEPDTVLDMRQEKAMEAGARASVLNAFTHYLLRQSLASPANLQALAGQQQRESMARRIIQDSQRLSGISGLLPGLTQTLGIAQGSVGVHADAPAQAAAEVLGARAFTLGNEIYLGPGENRLGTLEGKQLLAHELTHAAQQSVQAANHPAGKGMAAVDMPLREDQAEAVERAWARIEAKAANKPLLQIDQLEVLPTPGRTVGVEASMTLALARHMLPGMLQEAIVRDARLHEALLLGEVECGDVEIRIEGLSPSTDFHFKAKQIAEKATAKLLEIYKSRLAGAQGVQPKQHIVQYKRKSNRNSKQEAIPAYEPITVIPYIPKFKYRGSVWDVPAVVDNIGINLVNGASSLVNGLVSESGYIVKHGPWNYCKAAMISYKHMGLSIGNYFKNLWGYTIHTSVKTQFKDALRTYASPDYWEAIGTFAAGILLTKKMGAVSENIGKNVLAGFKRIPRLRIIAKIRNVIKKPVAVIRQNTAELEMLYRDAAIADKELKSVTVKIAAENGGQAKFPPGGGLKERTRVLQKIATDYNGDPSQLLDISRSTIEFDKLDDLYNTLGKISKEYKIVRIKDRFKTPNPSGYRDIMINMEMSNGHVVEMQLHLKSILKAKKLETPIYNKIRDIQAMVIKENRKLTLKERYQVKKLLRRSRKLYKAALKESK